MELKTRGGCCRRLDMVSLRYSTKQNPHNLRPHIVGSGSLCLVTNPPPYHQVLLHSMFLSSLLPAYGRHYFKCHSELNFYTTKPIKINLTRGYLFRIFLVFQSQRAPWVEAHTCHPSPHHWERWERWLKQGNLELEVILGSIVRPFLKQTKPQSAQSTAPRFAALS